MAKSFNKVRIYGQIMPEVYDVNKMEIRKLWEQVRKLTSHCEVLSKNNNIMRKKHIEFEEKITQLKQEQEVMSNSQETIMRSIIELREQIEQLTNHLGVRTEIQDFILKRLRNTCWKSDDT